MASGSFKTNVVTAAGSGYYRQIEVIWSSTNNTSNNTSTVSWTAYSRATDSNNTARWVNAWNITVTINGTAKNINGSTTKALYKDTLIGSGSVTIQHNSDGRKTGVSVAISASIWDSSKTNATYSGTINMDPNPVYTLSVNQGANTTVAVSRTSSAGGGSTGTITSGTKLYYGDVIKITASAASNYQLTSLTVNSANFTSGSSHTVTGNVSVASAAQALASVISVSQTSRALGQQLAITITKYNSSYAHSIQWSFAGYSGYITSSGGTQSEESKFTGTSVTFTVPTTWGNYIPSSVSSVCTLTCKTYSSTSSTSQLGSSTTASFTVTVPNDNTNAPQITVHTVYDTNSVTLALTGDSSRLVKYVSNAECTMSANSQRGATLKTATIGGVSVMPSGTPTSISGVTRTYQGVTDTSFEFAVSDSRGFRTPFTVTPTMVEYVNLTCVPTVNRASGTSETVTLKMSGSFYEGAFNAAGTNVNTLSLYYMYKENSSEVDWPTSWTSVSSSDITTSGTTYVTNEITVGTTFDYTKSYVFKIKAEDGVGNTILNSITKDLTLSTGRPIFDWGSKTFNFNVDVTFEDQQQTKHHTIVFRNDLDKSPGEVQYPHEIMIGGGDPGRKEAVFVQDATKTYQESGTNVYYFPFAYEDTNRDILLYATTNARARSYLADFPNEVKYDTTTGLYYRTWFSGTAEVWGEISFTPSSSTATGSLYYSDTKTVALPVSFSSGSPQVSCSQSYTWPALVSLSGSVLSFALMRAVALQTTIAHKVYIHVIGITSNYVDRTYGGGQEPSRAGAVVVTDEIDSDGGIIKHISAVDISNDTVDAAHLLEGYTAHDNQGNAITGEYRP